MPPLFGCLLSEYPPPPNKPPRACTLPLVPSTISIFITIFRLNDSVQHACTLPLMLITLPLPPERPPEVEGLQAQRLNLN